MKRLYLPIKDYPVYNNFVDLYKTQSSILNGGSMGTGCHTILWDENNIRSELFAITGDEKGIYISNWGKTLAAKPTALLKIQEIEDEFKMYQQSRKQLGYEVPQEMPPDMLNKYYERKARLTVIEAEQELLEKKLNEYTKTRVKEDDSKVLVYGLQCTGRCHGTRADNPDLMNVLKEIDGQKVELTREDNLIIHDARSPYNGMLVSDYRRLAKEWMEDCTRKEAEKFKALQESYREQGLRVPQQPPITGVRIVSRESLPKWPKWAKNYLSNEKPVKSTI